MELLLLLLPVPKFLDVAANSSILSYRKFPKLLLVGVAVRSYTNVSLVFPDGFTVPATTAPRDSNPDWPVPGHQIAPLICL